MSEREALQQQIAAARDAFWAGWGDVDPRALTTRVDSTLVGGPRWPGLRQAYRVVRRGSLTLIASDGLTDVFEEGPRQGEPGLGLEFFAVTKDDLEGSLPQTWMMQLVHQAAMNAASQGAFRPVIERHGVISMELYGVPVPDDWAHEGRVGVLLNVPDGGGAGVPPTMDLPQGPALAVNVKLLTPSELAYAVRHGERGREELVRRFAAEGHAQRSGLMRSSVVARGAGP